MTAAEPVRALVLERLGQPPRLETIEVLPPGPGQGRVRMRAAGLCHTDLSNVCDVRTTLSGALIRSAGWTASGASAAVASVFPC